MAGSNPQADLVATIGANLTGLQNGLREAVSTTQTGSRAIAQGAIQAEQALQRMNQSSNRAGFALTNLGRVAQDAPFGFIAIQNNISPLIDSFGSLVRETGSVGGAFRGLGSALIGPAGFGLAISVITSAVTYFIQSQQRAKSALEQSKKASDDYINSLDSIAAAQLRGEQAGTAETTRLKILYDAAINAANGKRKQNEAYDELNRIYPQVFTNSQRDATLAGNASNAYLTLANSIIVAAQAHAYEDQITKNTSRQIENQNKVNDLVVQESNARRALLPLLAKQQEMQKAQGQFVNGATGGVSSNYSGDLTYKIAEAQNTLNEILAKKNALLTDSGILESRNAELAQRATAAESKANFKTVSELNDKIAKAKVKVEPRDRTEAFGRQAGVTPTISTSDTSGVLANMQAWVGQFEAQRDATDQALRSIEVYNSQQAAIRDLSSAIGTGLTSAFQQVLAGSQSFLSAIGNVLLQLIEKLIAAAAAAALVSIALAAFTGGGSILGTAFGSGGNGFGALFGQFSGFSVPKFANGGIVTGPTLAMVGEGREHEYILPASQLDSIVNNSGGNSSVQVTGKISGTVIQLQQIREQKRSSRLG